MRTARELAEEHVNCVPIISSHEEQLAGNPSEAHETNCDRLTAAIEARDAEHANERLAVKLKAAKLTGALDVARTALGRVGDAPDDECYESGGIARAALAAIAKALSETPA